MRVLRFIWQGVLAFDRIGSRIPQLVKIWVIELCSVCSTTSADRCSRKPSAFSTTVGHCNRSGWRRTSPAQSNSSRSDAPACESGWSPLPFVLRSVPTSTICCRCWQQAQSIPRSAFAAPGTRCRLQRRRCSTARSRAKWSSTCNRSHFRRPSGRARWRPDATNRRASAPSRRRVNRPAGPA
jgi:hypothetical protein